MKQFTREQARENQRELERCLDKLGDDYTLAEFQQDVFRSTGVVVRPLDDERSLLLHRPISVKLAEQPHRTRSGFYWGLTGSYIAKPIGEIKFNGHYSESLLNNVKATAMNLKNK